MGFSLKCRRAQESGKGTLLVRFGHSAEGAGCLTEATANLLQVQLNLKRLKRCSFCDDVLTSPELQAERSTTTLRSLRPELLDVLNPRPFCLWLGRKPQTIHCTTGSPLVNVEGPWSLVATAFVKFVTTCFWMCFCGF